MRILRVDLKNPDKGVLGEAAGVLKKGGLLIYPTDTAYGLGANALDRRAIRKLYRVKGRGVTKPTHVVVRDLAMSEELAYLSEDGRRLIRQLLPGPLTLIFKRRRAVPNVLVGGLLTLGIRIPDCEVTKALSIMVDFPYTTPSANPAGGQAPYSLDEVVAKFSKEVLTEVDLFLDAGPLLKTPPSTIIDLSSGGFKVLRQGPISIGDVATALQQARGK